MRTMRCTWKAVGAGLLAFAFLVGAPQLASAVCVTGSPNGNLEPGEDCDDSNTTDTDLCRNDCTYAVCGDDIIRTSGNCTNAASISCDQDSDCPIGGTCCLTVCDNGGAVCGCTFTGGGVIPNGACGGCGGAVSLLENCELPYSQQRCDGGSNDGAVCTSDTQCPGGSCENGQVGCNDNCQNQCGDGSPQSALGETCDRICTGGPDGEVGDLCNTTCLGGTRDGVACASIADCPGAGAICKDSCTFPGTCTSYAAGFDGGNNNCDDTQVCYGGTNNGNLCTDAPGDCPGGGACDPQTTMPVICGPGCQTDFSGCTACGDGNAEGPKETCDRPFAQKRCGGSDTGAVCNVNADCAAFLNDCLNGDIGCDAQCNDLCGNGAVNDSLGEQCEAFCSGGADTGDPCSRSCDGGTREGRPCDGAPAANPLCPPDADDPAPLCATTGCAAPGGCDPAFDSPDNDNCDDYSTCLGGPNNGQPCGAGSDCPDSNICNPKTNETLGCNADCTIVMDHCDNCGDGILGDDSNETCELPWDAGVKRCGGTPTGKICASDLNCTGGQKCLNGTIGCNNTCIDECGDGGLDVAFGESCDVICQAPSADVGKPCNRTCVGGSTPGGFCFQNNDCGVDNNGVPGTCSGDTCAGAGQDCQAGPANIDDCSDTFTCLGGTNAGTACAGPEGATAECPGGKCSALDSGNVGCNADCTPALNCSQCGDGTTGNGEECDPPRVQMVCKGGDNDGDLCGANSDCAGGGTCGVFNVCAGGPLAGNACTTTIDCCNCEGDLTTLACGVCNANQECGQGVNANDLACQLYVCGNDIPEAGEQCDDGAAICDSLGASNGEPCDTAAQVKACEEVDAGDCVDAVTGADCSTPGACNGAILPDGCRANCRNASCGDGVADKNEICDDGYLAAPNAGALDVADDCPNGAVLLCENPIAECNIKPLCGDGLPHLFNTAASCDAQDDDPSPMAPDCSLGCGCEPRCKGGGTTHGQPCVDDDDCIEPADDPGVCLNPCVEPCDNGGGDLLLCLLFTPGDDADCLAFMGDPGNDGMGIETGNDDDCFLASAALGFQTCAGALQQCVNDANCGANGPCGNSNDTGNACREDCSVPKCGDDVKDNKFGEGCDNGVGKCATGSSGRRCQGGTTETCTEHSECNTGLCATGNCLCNLGNGTCELTCGANTECPSGQTCQMPWRLVGQCVSGMMAGAPCDPDTDSQCGVDGVCESVYDMVMICDGNGAECGSASDAGNTTCQPFPGQVCKLVAGRECKTDDDCDDNPPCQIDPAEGTNDCTNKCEDAASTPGNEMDAGDDCSAENPDGTPADLDNCNGQTPGQCSMICAPPGCGNGIIEGDEACDNGANNGVTGNCTTGCTINTCGDGQKLEGEACDDGNSNNCDSCNSSCEAPSCGDGDLCPPESCDDGNNATGDGCSAACCAEPNGNLTVEQKFDALDCTQDALDEAIAGAPDTVESRYRKLFDKAVAAASAAEAALPDSKKACRKLRSANNRLLALDRRTNIDLALGRLTAQQKTAIGTSSALLQGWYAEIRSQLGCRVVGH